MHLALARKYRPQQFSECVGQEHVTTTLANALAQNRLHHAYLFCGARGVGKTTVARIFAKALNCERRSPPTGASGASAAISSAEPCNACTSCEEITQARAMDVQEIDGASNTGVDNVREIRDLVQYRPVGERYKVIIIDEVHMLSTAAFNALLKTLEEPPPHVLFMFATTEPHKIPATILSRCQRYDFRRVASPQIRANLQKICAAEHYTIADDVLTLIALEADGSMRDAQSLLDQTVAFAGKTADLATVRGMLGFSDRTQIRALVEALCARDAKSALACGEALYTQGASLPRIAQEMLEWMRHCWVIAATGALPDPHVMTEDDRAWCELLSKSHAALEWQQWFALLYQSIDDLARSRFPKLAFDALLLQLTQIETLLDVQTALQNLEANATSGAASPETPRNVAAKNFASAAPNAPSRAPQSSTPPQQPHVISHANVSDSAAWPATTPSGATAWTACLAAIAKNQPRLASILEHAVVTLDAEILRVQFPKDSIYFDMLKDPERLAQLHAIVTTQLGANVRVELTQRAGPSAREQQESRLSEHAKNTRAMTEQALQNPAVQAASQILGAEIRDVKILASAPTENSAHDRAKGATPS